MPKQLVYVEIENGKIIRILKSHVEAWRLPAERVQQWPKSEAVKEIRRQVFERSNGECEFCGKRLTWDTGQMHEKVIKSLGGEVSLDNCVFICYGCHQGRADSEHGDRKWGGRKND